jgi:hypothetical protein
LRIRDFQNNWKQELSHSWLVVVSGKNKKYFTYPDSGVLNRESQSSVFFVVHHGLDLPPCFLLRDMGLVVRSHKDFVVRKEVNP